MDSTKQYINTARLTLRSWNEEDILEFARMNSDERVMEYFLRMNRIEEFNHPLVDPENRLCRHVLYKIHF